MTYLDDSEDSAKAHTHDEDEQKDAMQARVPLGVEDGEEDEPQSTYERSQDGETREDSFAPAHVWYEPKGGNRRMY